MDRSIRVGVSGFLMALTINFLTSGLLHLFFSFNIRYLSLPNRTRQRRFNNRLYDVHI